MSHGDSRKKADPRRDLARENQVIQLLQSGKKPSEVALLTGYHRNSVLNIRKRSPAKEQSPPRKSVRIATLEKTRLFEHNDGIWMITGRYGRPVVISIEARKIATTVDGRFAGVLKCESQRFLPEMRVREINNLIDLLDLKKEEQELKMIDKEVESFILGWDVPVSATG